MSNNAYWLSGLLALLLVIGLWLRQREGRIKLPPSVPITESIEHLVLDLSPLEVELGEVTFVQFSSTFCQPCRATRLLIEDVAKHERGVAHIEINAEDDLALTRRLNVLTTPTTIILDSRGIEVARATGAPKRSDLLRIIEQIRES
jgi:thiol-disulfide isomerase/thioredoxin